MREPMRVQRVITNETCNQNCWFCNARRPVERPEFVARPAVRRRIAEARAGDTQEIVLTGGEPTLRSDIADLVRRAGEGGARVVLETNGALIDDERARQLAAAGLCRRARPARRLGRRGGRDHARSGRLCRRARRHPRPRRGRRHASR